MGEEKMSKLLYVSLLAILLASCASGLRNADVVAGYKYSGQKFSSVNVELSKEVQDELGDNILFRQGELKAALDQWLSANNLLDPKSKNTIDVLVTDIRARSNFAAVMFGFFAGGDIIEGKVTPQIVDGPPIPSFEISATYALGGTAGGDDFARMHWLYDEFGKLSAATIRGQISDSTNTSQALSE